MRVAVCISGMSRSFKKTFDALKLYLLEPLAADVFVSTWKPQEPDLMWPDTDPPEEMIDLLKPKKFDIEIFNEARKLSFETNPFRGNADWAGDAVSRMIPMYYKIYLANLHKCYFEWENRFTYDVVIRCRSDLQFGAPVELEDLTPNRVVFPRINSQWDINDQFWYSTSSTADALSSLYLNIPALWYSGCMIHGETLLKNFVGNIGVECRLSDKLQYHIER